MKRILIALVSEQTIPNILSIRHFDPSELLFISTTEMKKKGKVESILAALNLCGKSKYELGRNVSIAEVQEDSILNCHQVMEKWAIGREDAEFIVNLTGGTKIMSIAAFEFFKDYGSKMIYIPLKNEYIVPFPKKAPAKPISLDVRLSVEEYLAAYGLKVPNQIQIEEYRRKAVKRKHISHFIMLHYDDLKKLLGWFYCKLRDLRKKARCSFSGEYSSQNRMEDELFVKMGFKVTDHVYCKEINKSDIGFLTGGWLEEYCYNIVHECVGKGVDDASLNIQIKNPKGQQNEFDVMFTSGNTLYFIECKSLDQGHDKETEVLYKIGALQKNFGLRVESLLVTTSSNVLDAGGKLKPHIQARAEQYNTEVVMLSDVMNLKSILSQKIKE